MNTNPKIYIKGQESWVPFSKMMYVRFERGNQIVYGETKSFDKK